MAFCVYICSTSRVSICCDSGSCVMGTILLFFFLSPQKKKVVTLDGPTRRNKTKGKGRRSGIYRIARKYGNPRQRYRAVSPSLFPFSVRRWWGPSISFLLSLFFRSWRRRRSSDVAQMYCIYYYFFEGESYAMSLGHPPTPRILTKASPSILRAYILVVYSLFYPPT